MLRHNVYNYGNRKAPQQDEFTILKKIIFIRLILRYIYYGLTAFVNYDNKS